MTDDSLVVYSDYVCPFCYLGRASLNEYLKTATDPPAVDWRFFDLRGHKRDGSGEIRDDVDDGKNEAYYERASQNVDRLQAEYDVEMAQQLATDIDSWNAQLAALRVRRDHGEEVFRAFHAAVFDALWEDGRDIGDPAVLVDIGEAVGVPSDEIRAALDDPELEAALEAKFAESQAAGVTGIPTFAYDGHVARGAVPPAQLRRLVEGI